MTKSARSAPLISIVIPCYNGMPYLPRTVRSVQNQDYQNWELVYVDDCSKDDSLAWIQKEAQSEPRIRVLKNEKNLGMVGAWNRALNESRGEYVKLLCADDILTPDALSVQIRPFLEGPSNLALVTSPAYIVDQHDTRVLTRNPVPAPQGQFKVYDHKAIYELVAQKAGNIIGEPSIVLISKAAILAKGGFVEGYKYGVDLEYWLRLVEYGPIAFTHEATAGFRLHPGSLTNKQMRLGLQEVTRILSDIKSAHPSYHFNRAWFIAAYWIKNQLKKLIIWMAKTPSTHWALRILILDFRKSA